MATNVLDPSAVKLYLLEYDALTDAAKSLNDPPMEADTPISWLWVVLKATRASTVAVDR